jgi:2-polyprenyl-3-methyl-5-hydroxy-6-metoxy-1,4-benzoquinol methylase
MDERSWWDLWNSSYRAEDNKDETASELFARTAAVINEMTQAGSDRVLEIGCGAGSLSRSLKYSSYHGLDMSSAAIDIARRQAEPTQRPSGASCTTYEVADFHEWPLPLYLFDVAVCVDAVAYFRDQRFVLRKIAQSLKTRGTLVLTTINPFVYNRIRRTRWTTLENGPVSNWLSRRELHTLIKSAGLTIEHSYTIMPRGNSGILRLVNARCVNQAFGSRSSAVLRRLKEQIGLGQYRLVVARKEDAV